MALEDLIEKISIDSIGFLFTVIYLIILIIFMTYPEQHFGVGIGALGFILCALYLHKSYKCMEHMDKLGFYR